MTPSTLDTLLLGAKSDLLMLEESAPEDYKATCMYQLVRQMHEANIAALEAQIASGNPGMANKKYYPTQGLYEQPKD